MNPPGKKLEPKLGIDMPFAELLGRLVQTDPKEVEESIKKSKTKKPPGGKKSNPPGSSSDDDTNVASLRVRRVRKRNTGQ
jgi:hypothetical protein